MGKHILFNNSRVNICLERLAYQLLENHTDFSETVLIGLQPRGKFLSQNIVDVLKNKYSLQKLDYGYLDITFFRDDFRTKTNILIPNETNFKLDVNNSEICLKLFKSNSILGLLICACLITNILVI